MYWSKINLNDLFKWEANKKKVLLDDEKVL